MSGDDVSSQVDITCMGVYGPNTAGKKERKPEETNPLAQGKRPNGELSINQLQLHKHPITVPWRMGIWPATPALASTTLTPIPFAFKLLIHIPIVLFIRS